MTKQRNSPVMKKVTVKGTPISRNKFHTGKDFGPDKGPLKKKKIKATRRVVEKNVR